MTNSLDIRELLTGDVNRLRYITRYSTSNLLHRENVAEHSYYVSLYAMLLCRWVNKQSVTTGQLSSDPIVARELIVLQRCLLHDLDETRTGDFQRPFKYKNEKLRLAIEEAAGEEFVEAVRGIFPEDPIFAHQAHDSWRNAKDDTPEGAIVAFADYLSVMSHLYAEIKCANVSVMQHYKQLMEYTSKFDDSRFDFLRPLVDQVKILVHEMVKMAGFSDGDISTM